MNAAASAKSLHSMGRGFQIVAATAAIIVLATIALTSWKPIYLHTDDKFLWLGKARGLALVDADVPQGFSYLHIPGRDGGMARYYRVRIGDFVYLIQWSS